MQPQIQQIPEDIVRRLRSENLLVRIQELYTIVKPKSATELTKGIVQPSEEDISKTIKEEYPLWLSKG